MVGTDSINVAIRIATQIRSVNELYRQIGKTCALNSVEKFHKSYKSNTIWKFSFILLASLLLLAASLFFLLLSQ